MKGNFGHQVCPHLDREAGLSSSLIDQSLAKAAEGSGLRNARGSGSMPTVVHCKYVLQNLVENFFYICLYCVYI